jgi:S1-C subfamily serine protease
MKSNIAISLSVLFALGGIAEAQQMHRWVDEEGQVHYSQTPPVDQTSQKSETIRIKTDGRGAADPSCCKEVRAIAEEVAGLLSSGVKTTEIYSEFPPSEYPEITEVVNFVSGHGYGGMSIARVGALSLSACMNSAFSVCRVSDSPGSSHGGGTRAGAGSGVFITETLVLTNDHVAADCSQLSVQGLPATIRASEPGLDLAVISVKNADGFAVWFSQQDGPELGEDVIVAGFPIPDQLGSLNVTTGSVTSDLGAKFDQQRLQRFQFSAPVQPGSSGGPILNADGRLIGLTVSSLNDRATLVESGFVAQNVNFGVSLKAIKSFLRLHEIPFRVGAGTDEISRKEVADQARDFTVQVLCNL